MSVRYNYGDIAVYQKVKGRYINLTNYKIEGDNEILNLDSDSKYIIVYGDFLNPQRIKEDLTFPFSEVDEEQLRIIGGFKNTKHSAKAEKTLFSSQYFALVCAEQILNTGYHKRIVTENRTALFEQRKSVDGKVAFEPILTLELKYKKIKKG